MDEVVITIHFHSYCFQLWFVDRRHYLLGHGHHAFHLLQAYQFFYVCCLSDQYLTILSCLLVDQYHNFLFTEGGRRGRVRMVVVFTFTYVIGAYHHWGCEFESRSGRDVEHYVIKLFSDLRPVCDFSPVSFTNKTDRHDIAEILLKVALNTIIPNQFIYIDRMIDQCLKIIHLLKTYYCISYQCLS